MRFSNGDPGVVVATVSSDPIALSAAAKTAGTTDPVAIEPPEIGPAGSDVSPSTTSILSSGTPVFSRGELGKNRVRAGADVLRAARDAHRAVVAQWTLASAGKRAAIQPAGHAPAERQAVALHRADLGRALDQPNFSPPSSKHSSRWRDENGTPSDSSIFGSFRTRSLTGIDLELLGQLVHRRLGGIEPGHGAGAAHVGGGADVAPGAAERHAEVGHAVWNAVASPQSSWCLSSIDLW